MKLQLTLAYIFLLQIVNSYAVDTINCKPALSHIIILEKTHRLHIHDVDLKLNFDKADLNDQSAKNGTLFLKKANVHFSGFVVGNGERIIRKTLNFKTAPYAFQLSRFNDWGLQDCSINAGLNNKLSLGLSPNVENAIVSLTEECLKSTICHNARVKKTSLQVLSTPIKNDFNADYQCGHYKNLVYNPTKTLNVLFDFVIDYMRNSISNNGNFTIPDLHVDGSLMVPKIVAYNGSVSGLDTLKRVGDLKLKHDKQRFSFGIAFTVKEAKIQYQKYKVTRMGVGPQGKISGKLKDARAEIHIVFNYNLKPCKVFVEKFDLSTKTELKLTGFSVLNSAVAKTLNFTIGMILEKSARKGIEAALNNIQCEKFRP
ncbi:hypothetical protein TKK_0004623 [Trichogramma kaykai]